MGRSMKVDRQNVLYLALAATVPILVAFLLMLAHANSVLPVEQWFVVAPSDAPESMRRLIVHDTILPRFALSLIAGAALALAGVMFQSLLRNQLAEPSTIGVSAGAQLALMAATFWSPSTLAHGSAGVAVAGAGAALLIVLSLSKRGGLTPLSIVIAGLMLSLAASAFSSLLVLVNHEQLTSSLAWQGGVLAQTGWLPTRTLSTQVAAVAIACMFMLRPVAILELGDAQASNLGAPVSLIRIMGLSLAVLLSAFVVNAVGVVGFVGLAAPALARALGARGVGKVALWAALIGAAVLCLADQLLESLPPLPQPIPLGAATAVLAVPLLLWLLPRIRATNPAPASEMTSDMKVCNEAGPFLYGKSVVMLVVCLAVALTVGHSEHGWHLALGDQLKELMPWRGPRVIGAMSAGALFAIAGAVLQRMTGNPMASPDVLGISAGASLGLIGLALIGAQLTYVDMFLSAATGSAVALAGILAFGSRTSYAPDRILLAGISLSTLLSAAMAIVLVSGDPRTGLILSWLSGSTYRLGWTEALATSGLLMVIVAVLPSLSRWLDILPLGDSSARGLGVPIGFSRLALLLLASAATAGATLLLGPLTFVGLVAPHIARMAGFRRSLSQLIAAALIGAVLMAGADWLGRVLFFPWQVPAGLMATAIGCPCFLWLMSRR